MAKTLHIPSHRTHKPDVHRARTRKPQEPVTLHWETIVLLSGLALSVLLFLALLWVDRWLDAAPTVEESAGTLASVKPVTAANREDALAASWTSRWSMARGKPLFLVETDAGQWVTRLAPPQATGTSMALMTTGEGSQYLCPSDAARGCVIIQP